MDFFFFFNLKQIKLMQNTAKASQIQNLTKTYIFPTLSSFQLVIINVGLRRIGIAFTLY